MVNQNIGTHAVTYINQGTGQETGAVSTTGTVPTVVAGPTAQWISQPFSTSGSQTTITRVELNFTIHGTGKDLTIDLQTDSAGNPSGTVLASLTFPLDFETVSATTISFPLNATGLSISTKYHIVIHGTTDITNYCSFDYGATVTNQLLTASSQAGPWTAGGATLRFTTYAGTGGVLRHTWEDAGARWTGLDYANGTSSPPTKERIYNGSLRSLRTMAYTLGALTTVS